MSSSSYIWMYARKCCNGSVSSHIAQKHLTTISLIWPKILLQVRHTLSAFYLLKIWPPLHYAWKNARSCSWVVQIASILSCSMCVLLVLSVDNRVHKILSFLKISTILYILGIGFKGAKPKMYWKYGSQEP
jgi:hypothetical protein